MDVPVGPLALFQHGEPPREVASLFQSAELGGRFRNRTRHGLVQSGREEARTGVVDRNSLMDYT